MIILPFMDIPVVDADTPTVMTRRSDLEIWADEDMVKFSAAFVCYEGEGSSTSDYIYQIGFIKFNCLVTTKKLIEEVGELNYEVVGVVDLESYLVLLPEIRAHWNLYFEKINSIPVWGTTKFLALREEGKTTRYLEGPHKGGRLRPGQRREIILDDRGEIVYGPMIKRTKI